MNTCVLCGRKAKDVQTSLEHVGGSGTVPHGPFCRNTKACWRRIDKIHNIRYAACQSCHGSLFPDEFGELVCMGCGRHHDKTGKLIEPMVGSGAVRVAQRRGSK